MKKLILTVAALIVAVGAQAQGYFEFATRVSGGDVAKFFAADGTTPLGGAGSDYWVQVFAGPSANALVPLTGAGNEPFHLDGTAARAGLTTPFSKTFTTTMAAGTTAFVGYQSYQGASFDAATVKSPMITTKLGGTDALQVVLKAAPDLPVTLTAGTGNVSLVPEPATLALGLIGLGTLLAFRRRQ